MSCKYVKIFESTVIVWNYLYFRNVENQIKQFKSNYIIYNKINNYKVTPICSNSHLSWILDLITMN